MRALEKFFKLSERGTTVRTELAAGLTTFLTMSYIVVVNPDILSAAGMDREAVFAATCAASAIGCLIMGLAANHPIALAPGMGLNAFFAFSVVIGMGVHWQVAMGMVFVSGAVFFLLSILPVRKWIIAAASPSMKAAISAGIGLFLAVVALDISGIIAQGTPAPLLTLGDAASVQTLLVAAGFAAITALDRLRIPGAVLIGIVCAAAGAHLLGAAGTAGGNFALSLPSLEPTFSQLDIASALRVAFIPVIAAFLFADLFDTTGTLVGVSRRAGLLDSSGRLPRMGRAFAADGAATVAGSVLGTTPVTSYIESAAGAQSGGKTGLVAVTAAVLFLASLFFEPIAAMVPRFATAPALLYVAVFMVRSIAEMDWSDATEYAPAVIAAVIMPLTYSISHGIAFGFILYSAGKIFSGRAREASAGAHILALIFLALYGFDLIG